MAHAMVSGADTGCGHDDRDISDASAGVALTGAAARTVIGGLSGGPLDAATLPFKGCAALYLGLGRVQVT